MAVIGSILGTILFASCTASTKPERPVDDTSAIPGTTAPAWLDANDTLAKILEEVKAAHEETCKTYLPPGVAIPPRRPASISVSVEISGLGVSPLQGGKNEIVAGNDYIAFVARAAERDFYGGRSDHGYLTTEPVDTNWKNTPAGRRWIVYGLRFKTHYALAFSVAHEYAHVVLGHLDRYDLWNSATRQQLELDADRYAAIYVGRRIISYYEFVGKEAFPAGVALGPTSAPEDLAAYFVNLIGAEAFQVHLGHEFYSRTPESWRKLYPTIEERIVATKKVIADMIQADRLRTIQGK